MQVWILQSSTGMPRGDFHRESAAACPGLLEWGEQGDELALVDIDDLPDRQPACQSPACFAGVERAGQLRSGIEQKPVEFMPFEPTKRVRLKPATRGSRSKRTSRPRGPAASTGSSDPKPPAPPPKPVEPAVEIGYLVTFAFLDSGETKTVKLVKGAAKLADGEISAGTPYAKAIIGAAEGDRATVELPGRKREVEIVSFEPA